MILVNNNTSLLNMYDNCCRSGRNYQVSDMAEPAFYPKHDDDDDDVTMNLTKAMTVNCIQTFYTQFKNC